MAQVRFLKSALIVLADGQRIFGQEGQEAALHGADLTAALNEGICEKVKVSKSAAAEAAAAEAAAADDASGDSEDAQG
jgi:hypothetical protein